MKIFRVTHSLYPYDIGGLPTHCHELSNFQVNSGNSVVVLTAKRRKKLEEVGQDYQLKQFKWIKMPWDFFGMENPICPRLWIYVLKNDFDILHAHSHLFFTSLFSAIICKIKRKPIVVTVHGVKAQRDRVTNFFQEVWITFFSRLIFNFANTIICLTTSDAKEIQKYGAKKTKIKIISNGINTELFERCDSNDNYLLWVGRYVPEKGLTYLVDALIEIFKEFKDKKIYLIGEGPLKNEIERKIRNNNLENFFILRNNCTQKEIADLMKKCEVYLLPSLKEGFPKSILEAISCGKPVITTNSLKEIVGVAGITVQPGNIKELENAIREVLSNPLKWRQSASIECEYLKKNWSWDIISPKIVKIYEENLMNSEK